MFAIAYTLDMDLDHFIKIHGLRRAARMLKKSPSTVHRWVKSGKKFQIRANNETGEPAAWEEK